MLLETGTIPNETPLEKTNFPCECHQLEIVPGLRMHAGVFFPSREWYPIWLRPCACCQSLWGHLSVLFRRLCFLGGLLIYLPLQSACLPLSLNSLSPERMDLMETFHVPLRLPKSLSLSAYSLVVGLCTFPPFFLH